MSIVAWLDRGAWFVICVTTVALAVPLARLLVLCIRQPARITNALVDAPAPRPLLQSLWLVLVAPAQHFHRKASRLWTVGYGLYHAAILLVLAGYALSILLLAVRWFSGAPIPDLITGLPSPRSTTPSNLLGLVFGNTDPIASRFLFGSASSAFRTVCLIELPLAVLGNLCLLGAAASRRWGALNHDLDTATRGVRLAGRRSVQRLAVRFAILSIIAMEIIGRYGLIPGIAYWHAALGLALIGAVPFTYLRHIPWSVAAILLAIGRRRRNATA